MGACQGAQLAAFAPPPRRGPLDPHLIPPFNLTSGGHLDPVYSYVHAQMRLLRRRSL